MRLPVGDEFKTEPGSKGVYSPFYYWIIPWIRKCQDSLKNFYVVLILAVFLPRIKGASMQAVN